MFLRSLTIPVLLRVLIGKLDNVLKFEICTSIKSAICNFPKSVTTTWEATSAIHSVTRYAGGIQISQADIHDNSYASRM